MLTRWEIPEGVPLVWADRNGLLHAFLNLARNSQRAMEPSKEKILTVSLSAAPGSVALRFADSGPGVASPEKLFRPFQPHPGGTGLGLYVSRCILRSFGGDLIHEPSPRGCCFVITLVPMPREESIASADVDAHSHPASR